MLYYLLYFRLTPLFEIMLNRGQRKVSFRFLFCRRNHRMAEKSKKLYILNSTETDKAIVDNAFREEYTVITEKELNSNNANDVVAYIPSVGKQSVSLEELPNLRVMCSNGTGY